MSRTSGEFALPPGFLRALELFKPKAPKKAKKASARALVKAEKPDLNQIAAQALAQVETLKSELGTTSYLDLVPTEYRAYVIKMADEAYPTKGRGTTQGEYREIMAQSWLGNRAAFRLLVQASGFDVLERGEQIPSSKDSACLVLTRSGSILALTAPENGQRQIVYERIAARVDADIAPRGKGSLSMNIELGCPAYTSHVRTSPVIEAATNISAQLADLKGAVLSMTMTHNTMMETVWKVRKPKPE